jgi:hypothetical protein
MVSSDQFKQALRAGKLTEAFTMAMSQAPELRITTWIASSGDRNLSQSSSSSTPLPDSRLRTQINLVEGTIDNEIGEKFLGNRFYQEVQQFHWQQVVQGHQTIQQNLESLQQIFRLLATLQQQQLNDNSHQLGWFDVETETLTKKSTETTNSNSQDLVNRSNLLGTGEGVVASAKTVNPNISKQNSFLSQSVSEQENNSLLESISVDSTTANSEVDNYILTLDELEGRENWSNWLEDDDEDIDVELLDLASLEVEESAAWQELVEVEAILNKTTELEQNNQQETEEAKK